MNTKRKTLCLLIALFAFSGCQKEEKDDSTTNTALLLALSSSGGDCVVNTSSKGAINTYVTDLTASGASKSGTISKVGTVPVVAHQTSALKFTITASTIVTMTGNAFGILYKSDSCPLAAAAALSYNSGFTTDAADSTSEFPTSHKIVTSARTVITVPGTYYYFFYAIPSRSQAATIGYTISP
ncbi:hypothetical protein EHQ58_01315 [Leptospira ognonensis]|uniref:Lipoprotein n=1 Tax=Leptospira ognonensis TaxID=2484945 RepID=A0A4R9K908_9LEPT|nr:hypothetical protein [Leptospira ognonensis]TGL63117.1 hypothetical protein EHQ58_01315 [Leptospira ognonensis]